jgi:hypothetical protein
MRQCYICVALVLLTMALVITADAQMIPRTDVVWARTTTDPITVDGIMNEAAWAAAESIHISYGIDNGMPGGGWFHENGLEPPVDPTNATVKFLVKGDSLYVGIKALDKSVGAGLFNHFDGILSNLRQRQQTDRPVGAGEIFYAWCSEGWADTTTLFPNAKPAFLGMWGSTANGASVPRPDSLSQETWYAATTVQGTVNDDADVDTGYTIEFRLNLKHFGYNVSQPGGDIVMYSLAIYDADYQWPLDTAKQSGNRVWYQCPWGNANAYSDIRVYARPEVGLTDALPTVGPEMIIPSAGNFASPVLDGKLDDAVWNAPHVGTLQIKFGDAAIRDAYPSTGPYRSGQYQPTVNGSQAAVTDPSLATIKYFYKADTLFLGFDVNDLVVQAVDQVDRWDGFRIIMCQRDQRNGDNVLFPRRLSFRVGGDGTSITTVRADDLDPAGWDSLAEAVQVVMALKGGTSIDTLGTNPDSGYTAEMRIVLPKFGYPAGRGDGVVFFGAVFYDGDSFTPATASYGSRAWYMREGDFNDGPAWWYMDPAVTVGVNGKPSNIPEQYSLVGNYPNPFNPATTISYLLPQMSDVTLEVYSVLGQLVSRSHTGIQGPGQASTVFNASNLDSGVYLYRVKFTAPGTQIERARLSGKMTILK